MRIDAHHHLWDLGAVNYPWLMDKGVKRFFGDPTPIQRDYLLDEFRRDASQFEGSVHIQVGAADPMAEAQWVQEIADENSDWPLVQVVFCDLTSDDLDAQLDAYQKLPTVRGVRQIVGRAPEEDAKTGTNDLLSNPRFVEGLKKVGARGLSFDLQLIPELYESMGDVIAQAPDTPVALCHAGSPYDRSPAGLAAWDTSLAALSDHPQVSCKLSGLGMFDHQWTADSIRPIVETCLKHFGRSRVMFGSNFPVDSLSSDYATLLAAYQELLPDADKPLIFGQNAVEFYRMARGGTS